MTINSEIVNWVTTALAVASFLISIVALWQTSRANSYSKEANDLAKRALESQTEPSLLVELVGPIENCTLSIENDAGCELVEIATSISVGFEYPEEPCPIRICISSESWPNLATGQSLVKHVPLHSLVNHADSEAPEGSVVNWADIVVDYSFVRLADRRRFNYSFLLGFMNNPDGRKYVRRSHEPVPIPSLKRHILKRVEKR